jgi:dethiobiotin synthetase
MKPVASGSERNAQGLRNADAELLLTHSARRADGVAFDYAQINPFAFADPIAPHLAAADAGVAITLDPIIAAYETLAAETQCVVVEGVGGWMAPLGAQLMQADLVRALRLPVILLVGLRLGCINHALLSARAVRDDGCTLLGWIGSAIDPMMLRGEDNIATLRELIPAPCLGMLPHVDTADSTHAVATLAPGLTAACSALSSS